MAVFFFAAILIALAITITALTGTPEQIADSVEPAAPNKDVLIVYAVGVPYRTISELSAADVDKVSGATPASYNTRAISSELASKLRARGFSVTLKTVEDVRSHREIFEYRVLVAATPVRFWNMSWMMKKFFDEIFARIYVAEKACFRDWPVAGIVMAEISDSAEAALGTIRSVLQDCGTDLSLSSYFLTNYSSVEREDEMDKLAEGIAKLVRDRLIID